MGEGSSDRSGEVGEGGSDRSGAVGEGGSNRSGEVGEGGSDMHWWKQRRALSTLTIRAIGLLYIELYFISGQIVSAAPLCASSCRS